MSSHKLTLAMIVRNESDLLPRFISSVQGLADEWIVVDTGSTDNSIQLLREAGATVVERPWENDFSKARNQSLELATGHWVLFLDADEFVSPEVIRQARELLQDENIGAATFRMVNRLPHGHARKNQLLRLFRRHPSVRFQHAIHEDVSDSVHQMLRETRTRLVHVSAEIEHVGYVRSVAHSRGKKERDVSLLQQCIRNNPRDFYSRFKLLEQARFWNDVPLWKEAATEANTALQKTPGHPLQHAHFAGEFVVLVSQGLGLSPTQGIDYLRRWQNQCPPSAALALRLGELLEQMGRFTDAIQQFHQCIQENAAFGNEQLGTVRPLLGLARIDMARSNWASALQHVEHALQFNPVDPEALLAGATLTSIQKSSIGLNEWMTHRIAVSGDSMELRHALGEEASLRNSWLEAASHFRKAMELSADDASRIRLAQSLLAMGDIESARQLMTSHGFQNPEAAIGSVLLNLLQSRDSDVTIECTQEAADGFLMKWSDYVIRGQNPLFLKRFQQLAPSLQATFPWLPSWLETQSVRHMHG